MTVLREVYSINVSPELLILLKNPGDKTVPKNQFFYLKNSRFPT